MRVVILVAMVPYNCYDYDDAYTIPSYACSMMQASYDHEYPYVYDAMVFLCVSFPMVMGTLWYTYHMIMVIPMVMLSWLWCHGYAYDNGANPALCFMVVLC